MVHGEARCHVLVLTFGLLVCVSGHMLIYSSVIVNVNIFVQYNSAFLMPLSSFNNTDPSGNKPYGFVGYPYVLRS